MADQADPTMPNAARQPHFSAMTPPNTEPSDAADRNAPKMVARRRYGNTRLSSAPAAGT